MGEYLEETMPKPKQEHKDWEEEFERFKRFNGVDIGKEAEEHFWSKVKEFIESILPPEYGGLDEADEKNVIANILTVLLFDYHKKDEAEKERRFCEAVDMISKCFTHNANVANDMKSLLSSKKSELEKQMEEIEINLEAGNPQNEIFIRGLEFMRGRFLTLINKIMK